MAFANKWENPTGTRAYYAWRNMRIRCLNSKSAAWENYGGRGISICPEWVDDYDKFYFDMGDPGEGESLDRINVDLGYSKDNCRWATWKVQANNKRTNRLITHNGVTRTLAQWADSLGWSSDTIHHRLVRMPIDRALTAKSLQPIRRCGTRQSYVKGCRCSECRAENASLARAARRRRALAGELATEAPK